jgi:hypothetical protein
MYTTPLSDEEIIKIKVVDVEELYNFAVDNFSFKIILSRKTILEFLKFEI